MTGGLGLTALVSVLMAASGAAATLAAAPIVWIGLAVAEIAVVLALTFGVASGKLGSGAAKAGFFLYAGLNGVTLAPIFLIYTVGSIAAAFLVSAGMFGAMALYGHLTKKDLSGIGHFALMALVGVILASIANMFIASAGLGLLLTYASVLIFVGLTAYDAQKIRQLAEGLSEDDKEGISRAAVLGALALYLDFLNLFLNLLKLLGKKKDD
jgi:FtsH-binding integral membrane protein